MDSRVSFSSNTGGMKRSGFGIEGTGRSKNNPSKSFRFGMKRGSEGLMTFSKSLKSGVTRVVFPEDLKVSKHKIFDPQDKFVHFWNKLLVVSCIFSVSVDPLFFYLPVFKSDEMCLHIHRRLTYATTTLRTIVDAFYCLRMLLQFRTAYIAPSSRVFGRGELVIDPTQIARRYLRRYFIADLLSVLPLPQVHNSMLALFVELMHMHAWTYIYFHIHAYVTMNLYIYLCINAYVIWKHVTV